MKKSLLYIISTFLFGSSNAQTITDAPNAIASSDDAWLEVYDRKSILVSCGGTREEILKTVEMAKEVAATGCIGGKWIVADFCANGYGGNGRDFSKILELKDLATPLAEKGDKYAQFVLGQFYMITSEDSAYHEWNDKAAAQGFRLAEMANALDYEQGITMPKDLGKSLEWYRKAAEHGDIEAMYNIAMFYEEGKGGVVTPNRQEAVQWLEKAAPSNHPMVLMTLGNLYLKMKENKKAYDCFYRAATQPIECTQKRGGELNVGVCYEQGIGVTADKAQAAVWYQKVVDKGFSEAYNGARAGLQRLGK